MPRLSNQKREKISEQILYYLFLISPETAFTSQIAREIARDEEFTKSLLVELKKKALVVEINLNKKGIPYSQRQKWGLSKQAFEAYLSTQQRKTPREISSFKLDILN